MIEKREPLKTSINVTSPVHIIVYLQRDSIDPMVKDINLIMRFSLQFGTSLYV